MNSAKLLVVDDEVIMRESLAGWLGRDGHAVQTASSGEAALKLCKETRFDILLVDIKMEGMNGLEVLRAVKAGPSPPRVYMLTNYTPPPLLEEMHGRGGGRVFRQERRVPPRGGDRPGASQGPLIGRR